MRNSNYLNDFTIGMICEVTYDVLQTISHRTMICVIIAALCLSSAKALAEHVRNGNSEFKEDDPYGSTYNIIQTSQSKLLRQAEKAEKKGLHTSAVTYACNALLATRKVKAKNTAAAKNLLYRTYPKAILQSEQKIARLDELTKIHNGMETVNGFENMLSAWKSRIDLFQKVSQLPAAMLIVGSVPSDKLSVLQTNYNLTTIKLENAKDVEAKVNFEIAEILLGGNVSKTNAKRAYYHLEQCLGLRPAYPDAEHLQQAALKKATTYVQIVPISGFVIGSHEGQAAKALNSLLLNQANGISSPLFVQLLSETEHGQADLIITTTITSAEVGKNTRKPVKHDLEKTIKEGDKEVLVKGTATKYEKFCLATITGFFEVRNSTGDIVTTSDKIWGQHNWTNGWISYNDERVLTRQLRIYKDKKELPFPDENLMLNDGARQFSAYLASGISNYLKQIAK